MSRRRLGIMLLAYHFPRSELELHIEIHLDRINLDTVYRSVTRISKMPIKCNVITVIFPPCRASTSCFPSYTTTQCRSQRSPACVPRLF